MTPENYVITRYATKRHRAIAAMYANVARGPGETPVFAGASCAGLAAAAERVLCGGVFALHAMIMEHEATDRIWRSGVMAQREIFVGDHKVDWKRIIEHGIEIREMKRLLAFVRRLNYATAGDGALQRRGR